MGAEILFALILVCAILAAPVLAIVALVRLRNLEKRDGVAAPDGLAKRIDAVEQSVAGLTSQVAELAARGVSPSQPAQPEDAAPFRDAPPRPAPPAVSSDSVADLRATLATPDPPRSPKIDLESMIAGRLLNRIGIVALLLAVGFFLKYAFDNDWIGPTARVWLGIATGSALLVYGQWLLGRGHTYFSEGIAALGAGVLYLSLYAAWGFYELVPRGLAFAGMIVVTAAMVALAMSRDSQRVVLLAVAGGLMTPGLFSTGEDQQIVLFTYLAVLGGGLLFLAAKRNWRIVEPVALVGTLVYVVDWYDGFYEPAKLARTLSFVTLFFVEFASVPLLRMRRGLALWPEQYALVLVNAAWILGAFHAMLYQSHRWPLTLAVLVLAAAHLAMTLVIPKAKPGQVQPERLLYAGLALTLATIAIPIRLEGEWVTMAWAIEGAVLIWSGFRSRMFPMRAGGFVLFLMVLLRLLSRHIDAPNVLLNARFATFAVAIAAFAVALFLARSRSEQLTKDEVTLFGVLGVATNVLGVWALSMEVWDFFGLLNFKIDHALAQQMGLSILWTVYATALIVVGVRRASPILRWQGLVLIGMAVLKVFLFDLSFLERAYRILSFLALGVVLLVVSFLYQRKLFGDVKGRSG